jgi:hypothetical protein
MTSLLASNSAGENDLSHAHGHIAAHRLAPATRAKESRERCSITALSAFRNGGKDLNTSDANVKEVVRTRASGQKDISPSTQLVGPHMAIRDAVTFEIAVAGLRQSSAVSPNPG